MLNSVAVDVNISWWSRGVLMVGGLISVDIGLIIEKERMTCDTLSLVFADEKKMD